MKLFISSLNNNSNNSTEELVLSWANFTVSDGLMGLTPDIWDFTVLGNFQFNPPAIRVLDKTFIPMQQKNSLLSKPYIVIYDHYTNMMTEPIDIGLDNEYGDIHNRPTIIAVDNRIYIHVAQRGGGTSVSPRIAMSNLDYDVRTFTDWTVLSALRIEYPQFRLLNNGSCYALQRYARLTDSSIIKYDGLSHEVISSVYRTDDTDGDIRPYVSDVKSYSDSDRKTVYRTFINRVENYRQLKQQYLLYLESDDLITWYNADRSYSHNTSTNGRITDAIGLVNYVALKLPTENLGSIRLKSAIYLENGNIYGLGGIDDYDNYGIIKYDNITKLWTVSQIVVSGHTLAKSILRDGSYKWSHGAVLIKDGIYFRLFTQVLINGYSRAAEFRSLDANSWEFVRYVINSTATSNNYTIAINYSDTNSLSDSLLMVTEVSDSGILIDLYVEPL